MRHAQTRRVRSRMGADFTHHHNPTMHKSPRRPKLPSHSMEKRDKGPTRTGTAGTPPARSRSRRLSALYANSSLEIYETYTHGTVGPHFTRYIRRNKMYTRRKPTCHKALVGHAGAFVLIRLPTQKNNTCTKITRSPVPPSASCHSALQSRPARPQIRTLTGA